MSPKRFLSGINPSSSKGLHLGNYLGAVQQHVAFQAQGECYYFIADLHSLNSIFDPREVADNTFNTYLDFLALGLDPDKCVFYIESDIPAIPQIQTILNNCVTVSEMNRMHAYKDKLAKGADAEAINMGLFNYPVLMAADILAFRADAVPVGRDQQQHVEICREMAHTFNLRYGDVLKEPEVLIKADVAAVIGTDGERKMSKSLGNDITIFADEQTIRQQIFATVTDRNRVHPTDPGDPDKNVLFSYMKFLGYDETKRRDYEDRYRRGAVGDVEIKKEFFAHYLAYFADQRAKRAELAARPDDIRAMMQANAVKANAVADQTLADVRRAVGLD
jgi:tryptophanyl-tRNA synthetase